MQAQSKRVGIIPLVLYFGLTLASDWAEVLAPVPGPGAEAVDLSILERPSKSAPSLISMDFALQSPNN